MMVAVIKKTIFVSFLITLAASCKFKYSPYAAATPKRLQNELNLGIITSQEASSGAEFKVAFLSDTHNYYDELHDAIKLINKNGPYSFVIIAGDITNYGLVEEYEQTLKQLNSLNYPYIVVAGNHDFLSKGSRIYERMFGKTDFSLTYKNVDFIFFNNNNWESPGAIPDKAWVKNTLDTSSAPFKVLVAHVSPEDKDRFSEEAINEWENLINDGGVNYFFNGHDHNPVEVNFGMSQRITIGAPSKGSYYELIVTPGGLTHQKISF
jgi:3',5'-cyclic-AMP phosphodiesterase